MGVIKRKNVERNVTLCTMLIQPSTTGLWLDFAQTQWLGNYWSPVCWHIILSSTKSPCCLLVEIHQPYLLQQCLDQGPRAICHTERSRRSGKIYKGRRNTVFRPEHEILSNRHLYYKHVDSACMYSQWQQRQHLVQEVEEIPFSQTWIWYRTVRQFILKTRQWQRRQWQSLN